MYNVLYIASDGVHEGQHRSWDCLESHNFNDLAVLFSDLKLYEHRSYKFDDCKINVSFLNFLFIYNYYLTLFTMNLLML